MDKKREKQRKKKEKKKEEEEEKKIYMHICKVKPTYRNQLYKFNSLYIFFITPPKKKEKKI